LSCYGQNTFLRSLCRHFNSWSKDGNPTKGESSSGAFEWVREYQEIFEKLSKVALEFPSFLKKTVVLERNLLEKWGTYRG